MKSTIGKYQFRANKYFVSFGKLDSEMNYVWIMAFRFQPKLNPKRFVFYR